MRGKCLLQVPADLSSGAVGEFNDLLRKAISDHPEHLLLDCSELRSVQSNHVGLLCHARELCLEGSVKVRLENTNDALLRTLDLLDLTSLFGLPPTREEQRENISKKSDLAPKQTVCKYSFSADKESVDEALYAFLEFLQELQLSEEDIFGFRTIFYEVATNIRTHARPGTGDLVRFQATYESKKLLLKFEDTGVPFDPVSHESSVAPQKAALMRQTRGFGICMIKKLADDISYQRTDDGMNVLSLTRYCGVN